MPVCRQVDVPLQSGQTRSPIWLDWNSSIHIKHLRRLATNLSDCGFLFISERDAMEFSPSFCRFHGIFIPPQIGCIIMQKRGHYSFRNKIIATFTQTGI